MPAHVTAAEVDYLTARLEALPLEGPVLDLGCGHGRHLLPLQRLKRFCWGLDADPLSLSEAAPRAPVVRGDFFSLPVRSRSHAAVFSWYSSLFTFDDARQQPLFAEIHRVLQPGGLFLFHTVPRGRVEAHPTAEYDGVLEDGSHLHETCTFNPENGRDEAVRTLTTVEGKVMAAPYFIRYYSLHQLTELLESVGFAVDFMHGDLEGGPLGDWSVDLIVGAKRV